MSIDILGSIALLEITPPMVAGITTFAIIVIGFSIYMMTSKEMREKRVRENREKQLQMQQIAKNQALEAERQREQERQIKIEFAKNMEISGRYEEAALSYDELEMYEKAGECRRLARTSYQISTAFSMGKDGAISVNCPNCGSPHAVESKLNMVTCKHCGHNYIIPKKVLDLM